MTETDTPRPETAGVPGGTPEPHPYALLLPALTAEEYEALKADIAEHGILYPVIVDEAGLVLDGVHRVRIAAELGIDPPVQRHEGLDDDRKLHLAVGLNMRRRHLDADRRRELVRRLHHDEGLSVRRIASVAGWSKSTVQRDLRESPYESVLADVAELRDVLNGISNEDARDALAAIPDVLGALYGLAEGDWKAGRRRSDAELTEMSLTLFEIHHAIENVGRMADGEEPRPWTIRGERWDGTLHEWWATLDDDEHERLVRRAREFGILDRWDPRVPSGTPAD